MLFWDKKNIIYLVLTIFVAVQSCSGIPANEIKRKYTTKESRFISVDNFNVHYKDEGRGEVLVLIHGILCSLHVWDKWTEILSKKYRIIRFDLPGFGITGPAFFEKHQQYTDFLEKLFNKLKLKKINIIGSSFGGYLAWHYVARFPKRAKSLILIDAAAYPQELPSAVKLFTLPVIGKITTYFTPRFIFEYKFKGIYYDKDKMTETMLTRYYELLLREGNRKAAKKLFDVFEAGKNTEPHELSGIKIPTLILWGKHDEWILFKRERWEKDLPHAKIIVYENAGHLPMEEIPEKSVVDVKKFLYDL